MYLIFVLINKPEYFILPSLRFFPLSNVQVLYITVFIKHWNKRYSQTSIGHLYPREITWILKLIGIPLCSFWVVCIQKYIQNQWKFVDPNPLKNCGYFGRMYVPTGIEINYQSLFSDDITSGCTLWESATFSSQCPFCLQNISKEVLPSKERDGFKDDGFPFWQLQMAAPFSSALSPSHLDCDHDWVWLSWITFGDGLNSQ